MIERADRVPVIVGVGQVNDRPADPALGLDPLDLMDQALRRADGDAGGGWLPRLDWLGTVRQISFPALGDPAPALATRFGAAPGHCVTSSYPGGDTPVAMLHAAAQAIAAGEVRVAAVVGGEALRTAAARTATYNGTRPDPMRSVAVGGQASLAHRYGLIAPVDVYPLYENACRAAWGQSLADAQGESGAIWAAMSRVAAANSDAWLRTPRTADEIVTPGPANRPIAWPYTKLQVANNAVNQGAGFIVTSLAAALDAGVPEARLVHVGAGAAAAESEDYLRRDRYDRSASMAVSLTRALDANGLTTADLDAVELYSCFPCVPKMARRVIGWPVDRPATVFGGLTFGGGPIGNYMSHAVASMVERLRREGRHGLLFANGGYATKNHTLLLTRERPAPGVVEQRADWQAEADAARDPVPPLLESYAGPGAIETHTVLFDRAGTARHGDHVERRAVIDVLFDRAGTARHGVVVARTPAGERFLARVPPSDTAGIAFLTGDREPIGTAGEAVAGDDGLTIWRGEPA